MQGSGISSESIWTAFDSITTASVRPLTHVVKIAWTRQEDVTSWAIVGSSIVDGTDIIKGYGYADLTKPDNFYYFDESDRAISIEYERILNEPLGGISLAQADLVLDNHDGRFTYGKNATIGTAILPNRPIQVYLGFRVRGQDKALPIIKGLCWMPQEDKMKRVCEIHLFDYLQYLDQKSLETAIYQNKRSDEIIEEILVASGFGSGQYVLDEGLNTIGFAWFKKGETAGERIRKICEAEEGHFYQDENGILRFENRRHYSYAPHNQVVWTFYADDILAWEEDRNTDVYNRVIVKAKPRRVLTENIEVWRNGITEELEKGEVKTIWAEFENPCVSIVTPVAHTDYTANTSSDGTGTDATDDIAVEFTAFTQSAKWVLTNTHGRKVYMTLMRLRGKPAVIKSEIEQIYQDDDSIDEYEVRQLEIENDFIDNDEFAYYLARTIVRKYRNPLKRIRILVRAVPQLQLKDKVRVWDRDLGQYKEYRVMKIVGRMAQGEFTQWLTLREVTDFEADSWAIVGSSIVGSETDVVGI